ncbi:MAG: RNA chaperone Hfq [Lachnospiraceae bacterium]|nr:RNA chaperone Hfq [Lachnospiraceae bacterium]
MDDFNFIGKKVFIELATGTRLDGMLVGADDQCLYVDEIAGQNIIHRIIYKNKITYIMHTHVGGNRMPEPYLNH